MGPGQILLTALILISMVATIVADLSYLHAANTAWPPHARLHAVWSVMHVVATHSLALGVLWIPAINLAPVLRVRFATLILLAYIASFFAAVALAPAFEGALAPDVPDELMPPQPLGIDGNLASFVLGTPFVVLAWWLCERAERSAGR